MKHTPGPWEVKQSDAEFRNPDKTDHAIIAKNGVCPGFVWEFGEEGQANARLIASAPELLGACKQALLCLKMDSDMEEDFAPEIKLLEQAITKAEGRI